MHQQTRFPMMFPGGGSAMHPQQGMFGVAPTPMRMPNAGLMPYTIQPVMYQVPMMQGGMVVGSQVMVPSTYGDVAVNGYQPVQGLNGTVRFQSAGGGYQPRPTQQQQQQQSVAAEEAKQRHFIEQQKRLQEFSTRTFGQKINADTLIESIIGKPDSRNSVKTSAKSAVSPPSEETVFSSNEDESFGDFLSGVACTRTPADSVISTAVLPTNSSAATTVTAEPNSDSALASDRKDLQSMMMECSDLSAPKTARSFKHKPAVRDMHVAKPPTVTYNASRNARDWSATQTDELSDIFTVPAPSPSIQAQPDANTGRLRLNSGSIRGESVPASSTFGISLPRWVTGELPAPELYHQVLGAVLSTDGRIETDLVYPLLLRSNLPREVLGYIWELCNKTTPGQLTPEELFLVLAMISIAQNNMDYSSLAILTRCIQAPVPNIGQFEISTVHAPQQPGASSTSPHQVAANRSANHHFQFVSGTAANSSKIPYHVDSSAALLDATINQLPVNLMTDNTAVQAQVVSCSIQQATPFPAGVVAQGFPHIAEQQQIFKDADDDFADFQAAPPKQNLSLGFSMNSDLQPALFRTPANADVWPEDGDKYAALRVLSVEKDEQPTIAASCDNLPVAVNDVNGDGFTDFSSFRKAGDTNVLPVSTINGEKSSECFLQVSDFNDYHSMSTNAVGSSSSKPDGVELFAESHSITASNAGAVDKYQLIKQLVQDPKLFKSSNSVEPDEKFAGMSDGADDDWADFQCVPETCTKLASFEAERQYPMADTNAAPLALSNACGSKYQSKPTESTMPTVDVTQDLKIVESTVHDDGSRQWVGLASCSAAHSDSTFNEMSVQNNFVKSESTFGDRKQPAARVSWLDDKKASSIFAQQQSTRSNSDSGIVNVKGSGPMYVSAALDMSPPDFLPDVDDGEDDFGFYHTNVVITKGMAGVSSLSNIDFEEEIEGGMTRVQAGVKDQTISGMKESHSSSSFEFTGWKSSFPVATDERISLPSVRTADNQSMDSFDLPNPPALTTSSGGVRSREDSPSRDSRSESSFEFNMPSTAAANIGLQGSGIGSSDGEVRSIQSLELKPTAVSPDELPTLPIGREYNRNGRTEVTAFCPDTHDSSNEFYSADFGAGQKSQTKPVDVKDLLDQGTLGMFGDRYSHLMHELQANDRHAYEWERCLEHCRNLLTQVEETFSSVSSSAICHEVELVEAGVNFLSAISNARLSLLVKDIESTWSNLAAIFTRSPYLASCMTLDLSAAAIKSGDFGYQQRACGLCLHDVDWEPRSKLVYGGRQYHSACANFWINFVDLTLPSLTVPELL